MLHLLYMTINAVGLLLLFFYERTMRPIGDKKLDTIGTVCRVTMYLHVWGMIGSFPFDLVHRRRDVASGDCQLCEYGRILAFSYCKHFRMKRSLKEPNQALIRDEQEALLK